MGIFVHSLYTGTVCIAMEGCTSAPVKNYFFICYSLVGFVNACPVGFQSQASRELSLGQHLQKLGVQICIQFLHGRYWQFGVGWREKAEASPVGSQSYVIWWPTPHVAAIKIGVLDVL